MEKLFEKAVDAIVDGDITALKELLRLYPGLVTERSERDHHATLLHYTAANGVEDYRQKTPSNIVEITRLLLDAGADVNAVGDMYGGSSTVGLASTSIHPARAGVQEAMIDLLLQYGADPYKGAKAGYTKGNLINDCLANGRGQAAAYLRQKGLPVDLEGAAGTGDLASLQSWLNEDGSLKNEADREALNAGFVWACEFGHKNVVEFLVEKGYDLSTMSKGMTGLHWAVVGGQTEMVRYLLEKGTPTEIENCYGGTVLGQALWSQQNDPLPQHNEIIQILRSAGAR